MNKRLIAFALVLLIAVGGVFALADDVLAEATLKATVASTFEHGFTDADGELYQTKVEKTNAFAETPPVLVYGFKAKYDSAFTSMMQVGDFELETDDTKKVSIAKVVLGGTDEVSPVSGSYEILSYEPGEIGMTRTKSVEIQIFPTASEVTNAIPGVYVATITVEIVSGS